MKIIVDLGTNILKSIYRDDETLDTRKGCFSILMDTVELSKKVKKGAWKHLKDENGCLLWDDSDSLKPLMGYEVHQQDIKVNIFNNLEFWTLKEVLEIKYRNKLKKTNYSHIFYEEFIDDTIKRNSDLTIGKRFCYGEGTIIHDLSLTDTEITFDCEYNVLPKIEISLDDKSYYKIQDLPFEHNFKKAKDEKKFYLKMNDTNSLSSYCVFFNSDVDENTESIGCGIFKK